MNLKTYDEILNSMKEKYRALTDTDPDEASDIGIRLAVLAGEIFSLQTEVSWLKNQMFPDTASGEYLDLHAESRGLSRKEGSKSSGDIIFWTNGSADDIVIPEGTVCATSGSNPVRFVTLEEAVIPAGRLFANASAQAVTIGASGNVKSNAVTVLVTSISGVSSVSNSSFSGGSDVETDEQLRARIIDSFVNLSNGTNKAFYIKSAMEVNGVTAVGVVPRNRGAGTVDVFITNAQGNPPQSLINEVREKLEQQREINVDIEVKALTLVRKDIYLKFTCRKGYNLAAVTQECEAAIREYFSTLAAGETMYVSDMGEYVLGVEGVKNYTINSDVLKNFTVDDDSILVPNNIYLTGEQES